MSMTASLEEHLTAAGGDVSSTKQRTGLFDLGNELAPSGAELVRTIRTIPNDRSAHVGGVHLCAIADGKTILCDRCLLSTFVFRIADGVLVDDLVQITPVATDRGSAPTLKGRPTVILPSDRLESLTAARAHAPMHSHVVRIERRNTTFSELSRRCSNRLARVPRDRKVRLLAVAVTKVSDEPNPHSRAGDRRG